MTARIVSSSYPISFVLLITFNFALKTRYKWPFSPHNPTASQFSLLSHLLPEPVYPSKRRWTDIHRNEPSRRRRKAADLQTTTGRTKNSPLTFPEASVAAVLFRTARQEVYSPPHTAIQSIEKRDPRRRDEPGSLRGGLCQTRMHLADQSVPPSPLPKGRRESYEEDGRNNETVGMSYRISYYTIASLGSSRGASCTTRVHGSLGIYSSSLQSGEPRVSTSTSLEIRLRGDITQEKNAAREQVV